MAIAHVTTVQGNSGGTDTLTLSSVAISSTTDAGIIVKIGYKDNGGGEVTGVVFNTDEAFTQVGSESKNGEANSQMWQLGAPTDATADVVISFTNSVRCTGGASVYGDVDQTNPIRAASVASANGTDDSPTVDVVALADEMVIDSMCQCSAGPDTISAQDGTGRHDQAGIGGGNDTRGASQEIASAGATETIGYTLSSDDNWATIGAALQQPGAGPKTIDEGDAGTGTTAYTSLRTAVTTEGDSGTGTTDFNLDGSTYNRTAADAGTGTTAYTSLRTAVIAEGDVGTGTTGHATDISKNVDAADVGTGTTAYTAPKITAATPADTGTGTTAYTSLRTAVIAEGDVGTGTTAYTSLRTAVIAEADVATGTTDYTSLLTSLIAVADVGTGTTAYTAPKTGSVTGADTGTGTTGKATQVISVSVSPRTPALVSAADIAVSLESAGTTSAALTSAATTSAALTSDADTGGAF